MSKDLYIDSENFMTSVLDGNIDGVKKGLQNPNVDPCSENNLPLMAAVKNGYEEVVSLLLADPRVDPSAEDNVIIRRALKEHHLNVIRMLLNDKRVTKDPQFEFFKAVHDNDVITAIRLLNDPRVDPCDENNYAIRAASEFGYTEIVELLLKDKRANPAAENNYAIVMAAAYGHLKAVELLLADSRVDPSSNNNYAFCAAVSSGKFDVADALLEDPRVISDPQFGFFKAVRKGDYIAAKNFLENTNVDPSYQGYAIAIAALYGYTQIIKLLLTYPQVDPSINQNVVIRIAAFFGQEEVVKILLADNRVDPSDLSNFALCKAAEFGYHKVVKLLLADPRVDPSANNDLAIKKAAECGHHKAVKYLLKDTRVNPTADNNYLLNACIECGQFKVVEELLKDARIDPSANNNKALELAFKFARFKIIALLLADPRVSKKNGEDLSNTYFPSVYQIFNNTMPKMIYLEKSRDRKIESRTSPKNLKYKCVYNNDAYLSEKQTKTPQSNENVIFIKGKPLYLDGYTKTPIGYNIHLPEGTIKAICVEIYGGNRKNVKKEESFKPGKLINAQSNFLDQGVAVVTLNLPDLLELHDHQSNMPEELFLKIQACIDHFYKVLSTNPSLLAKELNILERKSIPTFLFGASFGGQMCIRHAQLYPDNFDGYISHDGALSKKMHISSDLANTTTLDYKPYLDPAKTSEMEKISKPILVTQARDDNTVNAKVAIDFHHEMHKLQKEQLLNFYITEHSSLGIPENHIYKGHFPSQNESDFNIYFKNILNFILKKSSQMPQLMDLEVYRLEIIANKFYKKGTLSEIFLAEVFEKFETSLLAYIKLNLKDLKSEKIKNFVHSLWVTEYKHLYSAMVLAEDLSENSPERLQTEINRILACLTDEIIINMLKSQENIFSQFYEELFPDFKIPKGLDVMDLLTSKENIQQIRSDLQNLKDKDSSTIYYFLSTLYKANPVLLKEHIGVIEKNPKFEPNMERKINKSLIKGRTKLFNLYNADIKRNVKEPFESVDLNKEVSERRKINKE